MLSTPKNPAEAVVQGVSELLEQFSGSVALEDLQVLGERRSSPNAVLERKGVETGFVTTEWLPGHAAHRNEGRYDLYDLTSNIPTPW